MSSCVAALTFSSHADFEAFLESTVLTLVAMVLVDRAVAAAAACVAQVTTHRALEETLASLARQHAVVLTGALVAADDTLGVQLQPVRRGTGRVCLIVLSRRIGYRRDVRMLLRMTGVMVGLMQARRRLRRVVMQLRRRRRRSSVDWRRQLTAR